MVWASVLAHVQGSSFLLAGGLFVVTRTSLMRASGARASPASSPVFCLGHSCLLRDLDRPGSSLQEPTVAPLSCGMWLLGSRSRLPDSHVSTSLQKALTADHTRSLLTNCHLRPGLKVSRQINTAVPKLGGGVDQ